MGAVQIIRGLQNNNWYRCTPMKKFIIRIQPFFVIGASALVLLICAAGIAGFWIIESAAASSSVQTLRAVDHVAQVMRDGIIRVDTGLRTLEESVSSIEAASVQLSQDLSDKGFLLTLLPSTKEQELTVAAQSVRDNFASIRDFLTITNELVQAINKLPFISIPDNALASIETIQEGMGRMEVLVGELEVSIDDYRSQTAANISKITDAGTNLNNLLTGMRADLARVDAELNIIQVQSRQFQKTLPIILISTAIAATLMVVWIGYSQVVMIKRAVALHRGHRSSQAELGSGKKEVLTAQVSQPNAIEVTEVNDMIIEETDKNLQENTE